MKLHATGLGVLFVIIAVAASRHARIDAPHAKPTSEVENRSKSNRVDGTSQSIRSANKAQRRSMARCSVVADTSVGALVEPMQHPVRFQLQTAPGEVATGIIDFHRFAPCCTASFKYQLSSDGKLELALGGRNLESGDDFWELAARSIEGDGTGLVDDGNWILTASCDVGMEDSGA